MDKVTEVKYAAFTDEELNQIVDADDHNYRPYEDGADSDSGYVHVYWDCPTCDAEEVLDARESRAKSLLPGYLPEVKSAIMHNVSISDLKVGSFARYSGLPGAVDDIYYVECLSVEPTVNGGAKTSWKRTNSEDEPFSVTYPSEFSLSVVEPTGGPW